MRITDAQIHLWSRDGAPPHHWRTPYTIERAIAEMDEAGVDRAVNCPAIWDASANDYAVEAATLHPERFATLGWLPLTESASASDVNSFLERPGMLGLRFVVVSPDLVARLTSGALDWLWQAANHREIPVGLMVAPAHLPVVADIAKRYPRIRFLLDHLSIGPSVKLPEAAAHLSALVSLAELPNIAVKATGTASMATDPYPFLSTHDLLHKVFDAFGPERFFWGTDITRMRCSWRECVTMFTESIPWLKGEDLEQVMGGAISDWIGWP